MTVFNTCSALYNLHKDMTVKILEKILYFEVVQHRFRLGFRELLRTAGLCRHRLSGSLYSLMSSRSQSPLSLQLRAHSTWYIQRMLAIWSVYSEIKLMWCVHNNYIVYNSASQVVVEFALVAHNVDAGDVTWWSLLCIICVLHHIMTLHLSL